jgi:hypothetical protein
MPDSLVVPVRLFGKCHRKKKEREYTYSENASPHSRPPTSNAIGIERMIERRKIAEEITRKNHISAVGAGACVEARPAWYLSVQNGWKNVQFVVESRKRVSDVCWTVSSRACLSFAQLR